MANKKMTEIQNEEIKKEKYIFIKTKMGFILQGYSIVETNGLCKTLGITYEELDSKCKDNKSIIYR